jgi:hypothetical protein
MILKTEFYTIMDRAIAIKRDKYQRWPVHVVAQAGKVFHKSGELMKAASEYKYEKAEGLEQSKEQHDAMETLCLETIATCLRFLEKRRPFSHPDLPAVEPEPEPNPHQITLTYDPSLPVSQYDGVGFNPMRMDESGPFPSQSAKDMWENAVQEHAKTMETPFPDVLDEITPEQLEQAALLLDEPDHTFTEKNPE